MIDETLRLLAEKAGVSTHWTDQSGGSHDASPETLRALLVAIGYPASNDAEARNSLSVIESGMGASTNAQFVTARVGQPIVLPVSAPAGALVEIELENGARRTVVSEEGFNDALSLPAFTEAGYHRAHTSAGVFTVATAPERCVTIKDLLGDKRGWATAAQIYSLRTAGDGGIGNLRGVADLGRAAGAAGADALAISPMHALFGAAPGHFSPYSPSTRLFYNPLHASVDLAFPGGEFANLAVEAGVAEEMARLEALPEVDWMAATPARMALFRRLYAALRDRSESHESPFMAFHQFRRDASPLLKSHAVFEVLHKRFVERDQLWNWRDWPDEMRQPDSQGVADFAAEHSDDLGFEIFLQWIVGRSYAEAQRVCRVSGMAIGLVADLAIGMDGSGSHAWSRQHEILHGVELGAPPDYYSADGQKWGLTNFSPRGLAASGFSPFIETLRAGLRYVGGLRVDHVMGMSRLWLVPKGASPREGAFVAYPSETLFRLAALESLRHNAVLIGEDLGTLPDGFRDYLRSQGVAGMRVLRFEKNDTGYVPPRYWDEAAVAMTTTHDLVATAGWWAGDDIDQNAPNKQELDEARAWDRGVLWGSFCEAGVASGERPEPWNADPVVAAAIRYVAKTPSHLRLVAIEDILGVHTQPNVPGTTSEKPNWRHRLPGEAGELLAGDKARSRLPLLRDQS